VSCLATDPTCPLSAAEFRDLATAYVTRLCDVSGPDDTPPLGTSVITHLKAVVELTAVSVDVREGAAWCLIALASVSVVFFLHKALLEFGEVEADSPAPSHAHHTAFVHVFMLSLSEALFPCWGLPYSCTPRPRRL
jgi:hypothetical protein